MRLVSVKRETHHHRGYRIEGVRQGEGMLLSVLPTRPKLPTLKYSRFRTLRGSWINAVSVVTGYIDEALKETLLDIPPEKGLTDHPLRASGSASASSITGEATFGTHKE
jgi:hypothetical protein